MADWILRRASQQDRDGIIQLLKEGFSGYWTAAQGIYNQQFREWFYCNNPGGGSITLVAENKGKIIGHLAIILERLSVNGTIYSAGVAVHLAIQADYRKKGIFKNLGQLALEKLTRSKVTFSLAVFPNDKSRPGFLNKLNFSPIVTVPLLVKPLRIKNILARITKSPFLAAVFSFLLRPIYHAAFHRYNLRRENKGLKILPIDNFGAEFDSFWKLAVVQAGVIQQRDARFLNWRFNQSPGQSYQTMAAFRNNELAGYITTRKADIFSLKTGIVMDYLVLPGAADVFHSLLKHALDNFRKEGVDLCIAACLKNNIYYRQLQDAGFLTVPAKLNPRKFLLTGRANLATPDDKVFMDKKDWFFTFGDWDVF
ncbi:MAG: GNAT family N-acetyltransferase [Candidatus Omnitrophota bacterium]